MAADERPALEPRPASGNTAVIVPVELPVAVRRLRDRLDPSAVDGVPAHVTLLFPFLPPAELDEEVRGRLAAIIGAERPFPFTLARVGRWPDVVYLAPEPDAPFLRLIEAVAAAFPEHPPYGGAHADVVPHVTIAQDPRPGYLEAAEHALPALLPIRDVAREAWLVARLDAAPWRTLWRLPLGEPVRR